MNPHLSGPSGRGTVVLDLGAEVGALILYTPAAMDGEEIDITGPASTHSMVRRRDVGTEPVYAAVYPELPEGEYVISGAGPVAVVGGQITTHHWVT
jgi:hypothetical protein